MPSWRKYKNPSGVVENGLSSNIGVENAYYSKYEEYKRARNRLSVNMIQAQFHGSQ